MGDEAATPSATPAPGPRHYDLGVLFGVVGLLASLVPAGLVWMRGPPSGEALGLTAALVGIPAAVLAATLAASRSSSLVLRGLVAVVAGLVMLSSMGVATIVLAMAFRTD